MSRISFCTLKMKAPTFWRSGSRSVRKVAVALGLAFTIAGPFVACSSEESPTPPTHLVEMFLGGALPAQGRVGAYAITFERAQMVLADWALYGCTLNPDGEAVHFQIHDPAVIYHGGHLHGEAEYAGEVVGAFVVDLLAEPRRVATLELTEAHYFDGRLRLLEADAETAPSTSDGSPLAQQDPLWGHTLILEGAASDGATPIPFSIQVDVEATVAGLEYGANVDGVQTTEIVTLVDVGALLADIDFKQLASENERPTDGGPPAVVISPARGGEAYLTLKARLKDPEIYLDPTLLE